MAKRSLAKLYNHPDPIVDAEFRNAYKNLALVSQEVLDGLPGAPGEQGLDGDPGPPGPDGNSNVQVFKTIVTTGGQTAIWTQPQNAVVYNYFAILIERFAVGAQIEYFFLERPEIVSGQDIVVRRAIAQGQYDSSIDTFFSSGRTLSVFPVEQQLIAQQQWNDAVFVQAPVNFYATTDVNGEGGALDSGQILVYIEYFILNTI